MNEEYPEVPPFNKVLLDGVGNLNRWREAESTNEMRKGPGFPLNGGDRVLYMDHFVLRSHSSRGMTFVLCFHL